MKKILLICLPFLVTACTTDVYIPGVSTPTVYYPAGQTHHQYTHSYQQPYYNNNQQHHDHDSNYYEHHDNGKHKGQYKQKHHDD